MTPWTLSEALGRRGRGPVLYCHIGEGTERGPADRSLGEDDRVVDLALRRVDDECLEVEDTRLVERTAVGTVVVVAATPTDLRRAVPSAAGLPGAARFVVVILAAAGHLGPPVPVVPGMGQWEGMLDLRVSRFPDTGWEIEFFFTDPVSPLTLLTALSQGLTDGRSGGAHAPLSGVRGIEAGLWRPGDPRGNGTDRVDVLLDTEEPAPNVQAHEEEPLQVRLRRRTLSETSWRTLASPGALSMPFPQYTVDDVPPVDEQMVNPTGFLRRPKSEIGQLTSQGGRWVLRAAGRDRWVVPEDGTLTDTVVESLRDLRGVRVTWERHSGPLAAVRAVAGLAAAGVPLVGEPPPSWADCLGEELHTLLTSVDASELDDDLRREEHSIRLRRSALRTHGTRARWRSIGGSLGLHLPREPKVSVLLCTRRPDMVGFALRQIARQRDVDFEVVLGAHGFGMDLEVVREAVAAFRATGRHLVMYEAEPELPLGVALNNAASRASGDVFTKMDDDDWYGPYHLSDLLLARQYSGAEVVGNGVEYIYLESLDLTVRRAMTSECLTRRIGGGTITLDRRIWEEIGGFRPTLRAVDTHLMLALRLLGGRIYRTHTLNYVLRRTGGGHTWTVGTGYFLKPNAVRQLPGWQPSALLETDPQDRPVPTPEVERRLREAGVRP